MHRTLSYDVTGEAMVYVMSHVHHYIDVIIIASIEYDKIAALELTGSIHYSYFDCNHSIWVVTLIALCFETFAIKLHEKNNFKLTCIVATFNLQTGES